MFLLLSWFSKLFYNYHSPFLLSERREPRQKTVGMFGAFEFVGIMGASVSDRWEQPERNTAGILLVPARAVDIVVYSA